MKLKSDENPTAALASSAARIQASTRARSPGWLTWMVPTLVGVSLGMGCAHQPTGPGDEQVRTEQIEMNQRLDELQRANGRLSLRIEELEDQLFLLQDMTESNRIALRRHGYMQRGTYLTQNDSRAGDQARAPGPTPESYSGTPTPYGAPIDDGYQAREAQRANRDIRRIELPSSPQNAPAPAQPAPQVSPSHADDEAMVEVVITDEQFRDFVGDDGRRAAPASSASSSAARSGRAQAPVTDEKLGTSKQLAAKSATRSANASPAAQKKAAKNSLALYKAALADYQSGSYARALAGFEAFLAADPNPTYIDNGLYWIGECHYGLGDYQQATASFQRVLSEQPDGNKVPDAMLKMSLAYERMNDLGRTRELLEKLTDRYPTTNAGRLGAQKLAELPERPLQN